MLKKKDDNTIASATKIVKSECEAQKNQNVTAKKAFSLMRQMRNANGAHVKCTALPREVVGDLRPHRLDEVNSDRLIQIVWPTLIHHPYPDQLC